LTLREKVSSNERARSAAPVQASRIVVSRADRGNTQNAGRRGQA
jgi:hypothetical protein